METPVILEKRRQAIMDEIAKEVIPRYVYKYMSCRSIFQVLANDSIKFSNSTDFNDPFDGKAYIEYDFPDDWIIDYFKLHSLSDSQKEIVINKKRSDSDEMQKLSDYFFRKCDRSIAISCFSKTGDNVPMWAHYSDNNRGVCLKFDITKDVKLFHSVYPVDYQEKSVSYRFSAAEDHILKQYTTKGKCWESEQEIRVIKSHTQAGLIKFNKASLIEIAFGCCCTEENKKSLKQRLRQYKYENVKLSSVVIAKDYQLNWVDER